MVVSEIVIFLESIGRTFPGEPFERTGGVVSAGGLLADALAVDVLTEVLVDVLAITLVVAAVEVESEGMFVAIGFIAAEGALSPAAFGREDVSLRRITSFIFATVFGPTCP